MNKTRKKERKKEKNELINFDGTDKKIEVCGEQLISNGDGQQMSCPH